MTGFTAAVLASVLALAAAPEASAPPVGSPPSVAPASAPLPSAAPIAAGASALPMASAHWPIRTTSSQAQALFDRGLAMLWAFDVAQARLDFVEAAKLDPDCAMAYWGMAEADTIDINIPTTPEGEARGAAAVGQARRHLAHAGANERALIDAMAQRFNKGTTDAKFKRFNDAMAAYVATYPNDANAFVVAGYATITAADDLVDKNKVINAQGKAAIADADHALALDPGNIGAHHLRIHTLENVYRWDDAVSDARALESLSYPPGESHLPHMAGHIWARTGDYDALVRDNETAVDNDRAWNALGDGPGQQYMRNYHYHDVSFVLYGLTTVGEDDEAQAFVAHEDARAKIALAVRLHQDLRVKRLAADGHTDLPFYEAIAAARRGDLATAKTDAAKSGASDDRRGDIIAAAEAIGAHDPAARVRAYAKAYAASKNDGPGDPKDYWATPIGEGYGAALLVTGKPADAEAVFAAELKRFPNDPHLEWGLAQALAAQGKDDALPRAAYHSHWKGSRDLTLDDLG